MSPIAPDSFVDVTDPGFRADPFPTYARMRSESPAQLVRLPLFGPAYLLTRYDDVSTAFRDERLVKNPLTAKTGRRARMSSSLPGPLSALSKNLLSLDGADHDRLRSLVHRAFTPRRIESMQGQADQLSKNLLADAAAKAAHTGRFDLIADFALPLPLTLIGQILGVPQSDNDKFHAWTVALLSMNGPRSLLTNVSSVLSFMRYLRKLIEAREHEPRDDLISALAGARMSQERLTADEVLAMVILLLTAGHETTVNLIGTGTLALLQNPDQLNRLRDDPHIVGTGVEELLRYVAPAETATQRWAREDIEISGQSIPRGAMVLLGIAAANRDPSAFPDPDRLDLTRQPNRHLSFGQGIHYCLGAYLSRLEASIAIPNLLRTMPNLRLAVPAQELPWRTGLVLRGVLSLPVTPA